MKYDVIITTLLPMINYSRVRDLNAFLMFVENIF